MFMVYGKTDSRQIKLDLYNKELFLKGVDMSKPLPLTLPSQKLLITFSFLSFFSFALPFSLGHPQLLVGTIVNACLFTAALYLPVKFLYALVFFPSLGVLSRGLIFGPLTSFLVLMLPFIWLGNVFLINVFKKLYSLGFIASALLAAILKTAFLFTTAFILVKVKILPQLFLVSMGQLQLVTALLGASLSFIIRQVYESNS